MRRKITYSIDGRKASAKAWHKLAGQLTQSAITAKRVHIECNAKEARYIIEKQ